jgi:uncharacterized protein YjbI with pentapeptide repeats
MDISKLKNHRLEWGILQLRNAILPGADLIGANLYGADLYEANLYKAKLCNANLRVANLYRANLSDANLHGANLSNANLYEANLSGANLHEANLYGARGVVYMAFDPRGWVLVCWKKEEEFWFNVGRRSFSYEDALTYWGGKNYSDPERGGKYVIGIKTLISLWS